MSSGANAGRSCRGCPGCPPRLRFPCLSLSRWGRDGLTISLEGGLDELKQRYQRMKGMGVEIDFTTDHGLSQSVYFFDPDGNRLEVFCETMSPEEGIDFMRAGRAGRDPLELEVTSAS